MNIQNRKHMLKWHSWNTNRKLRVLVSMIMIFYETQCLSNWETFPTILKIFSITHKLYHMWLCLKLEAIQSDFLLTTTVAIAYLGKNLLVISFYNVYISISNATTSEIQQVYDTLKNWMCKNISNHVFL